MEKVVLWDKELVEQFLEITIEKMDSFLELIQYIQERNIKNVISEIVLEKNTLWEWIYSKDDIELNDMKRELSKKIQKAQEIVDKEADELKKRVGNMDNPKVFVLYFSGESVYYVESKEQYFRALWQYLSKEKKNTFSADLKECFPNLIFHEDVDGSLNTLNRKFEEIRDEIVEHLGQLNNYQKKFLKLVNEHKSYREIAEIFTADTGIECSPQADRNDVKGLKIKLYNSITEKEEDITCELHTKFSKFNINREKQDRIYFFPGKNGIANGCVVIKHIGKHL